MKTHKLEISSDKTIKIKFPEGHSAILIPKLSPTNYQIPTTYTLCLSTQIGCPMACTFCLSGKTKFQRNLTLEELKQQLETAKTHLPSNQQTFPFSSIVFMGMGEPLLNLENIIKFCEWINKEHKFSYSKITISTSGIIPQMKKIIEYKYPIQLALSLHSTKQKTRNKIMPRLKQYPIKNLIEVCQEYNKKYKQKIMIEYLMIKGLTDTNKDLQNLINYKLTKYTNFNLIPLNKSPSNSDLQPSTQDKLKYFKEQLRSVGYKCFIRTSTGQDIKAACGMLK